MNVQYNIGDIVLGTWKLTQLIGEGSFGRVYEAEREDFGRVYKSAIKIITIPQSQAEIKSIMAEDMDEESVSAYFRGFVEELVDEFSLMSKLKGNSNIVSYEDHSVIQHAHGIGWDILIRMELLVPFLDYLRKKTLTKKDIMQLGIDICLALELCQKYNIMHRDIKPENIFVSENGDFKLGDFGIARTAEKTTSGLSKKGTYRYMAPEIYRGESYGPSVDIYSLGIVLYRLLNDNRTPFMPSSPTPIKHSDSENAQAKRMSGVTIPPPKNADGRLAEIVLKACAYNPKHRYSSPVQMRQELEAIQYSQEEALIIYPKGDEVPIKSLGYVEPSGSVIPLKSDEPKDVTVSIFDENINATHVLTQPEFEMEQKSKIDSEVEPEKEPEFESESKTAQKIEEKPELETARYVEPSNLVIPPKTDEPEDVTVSVFDESVDATHVLIQPELEPEQKSKIDSEIVPEKELEFESESESKTVQGTEDKPELETASKQEIETEQEFAPEPKRIETEVKTKSEINNSRKPKKFVTIGAGIAAVLLLVISLVVLLTNNEQNQIAVPAPVPPPPPPPPVPVISLLEDPPPPEPDEQPEQEAEPEELYQIETIEVSIDSFSTIYAGSGHSMAIKSDGTLWAWGINDRGQIGDGTYTEHCRETERIIVNNDRYRPVMIMEDVMAVSAGRNVSYAIQADGTLWAWGNNTFGQLGDGTNVNRYTPVMIMEDIVDVSAGWFHTVALKSDGSLWTWGAGTSVRLAPGGPTPRRSPVRVMDDVMLPGKRY